MSKARFPAPDGRVRIVPSLLAADFGELAKGLEIAESAGAKWISLDVMDGHFVPNLSFGPDHLRALRPRTKVVLDAHLMVTDPGRIAPIFAEAGADLLLLHVEACRRPRPLLRSLRRRGIAMGLAVKPATPASALLPYLDEVQVALVMTVEPGFGGQPFREDMAPKIRELRRAMDRRKSKTWLMVDGGVGLETAAVAAGAGADAMVAGTSFYRARNPAAAFRAMTHRAQEAFENRRN